MQRRVVTLKLTDVSEVRIAAVIRAMMEAVRTSETSVNFNVTTRRYIPEDSKLHGMKMLIGFIRWRIHPVVGCCEHFMHLLVTGLLAFKDTASSNSFVAVLMCRFPYFSGKIIMENLIHSTSYFNLAFQEIIINNTGCPT
jgi:hypothetical protein